MSDQCRARLLRGQDLQCDRNSRHYNKPHRASGSWMTNDGRLVTATVTWAVGSGEWNDDGDTR